ncbi:MAG TPA: heparan-alpha-glucosaminide N-acetyltransferase domain-containing protein, partial [Segetibacter sp.]
MKRVLSIDIVRGLVMIIMALDHTRDLIHVTSLTQVPTDLLTTTPALFFTRLVTHVCAPTFVFLSGVSAYISLKNRSSLQDSRRFLITRGIWLFIVEFTLVNFGIWFDIHFAVFLFDVIAAIGFGFIITGLLLKVSARTIGIIGLAIIFLHNLVPLAPPAGASLFSRILMALFSPGAFPFGNGRIFVIGYPPIPGVGLMLTGFAAGK